MTRRSQPHTYSCRIPFQRLRGWYGYHPDRIEKGKGGESLEPSAALSLSISRKQKKPAALAAWQAYSQLYFKKGTPFHTELHADYDRFKAGEATTRSKYSYLFPEATEDSLSTINWLPFYQAVMTHRAKNVTEEERAAIAGFIEVRHQKELDIHERPWRAIPGSEDESEEVKVKKFHKQ